MPLFRRRTRDEAEPIEIPPEAREDVWRGNAVAFTEYDGFIDLRLAALREQEAFEKGVAAGKSTLS